MASWKDSVPQFNPYVQQLPVEAMVKVGMHKQQKYDEGIQKIQTNIDNIAGLDVVRDIDKKYLQSKLNQLGNDLKYFMAGDFSDSQLVNSVNGMTNQIVKDKNVQNAVSSAAAYRKQVAEMEKAISEGKSSQANIYDFEDISGRWLSSNKLEDRFSGRYTQYTDVNKKWMETMKALHPQLAEYDLAYEMNSDGSVNYNKVAAAMQRITKESVSAAQIENAIRSSLTPDDLNQLRINAKYDFRGYDENSLMQMSLNKYEKGLKDADDHINILSQVASLSVASPQQKKQAEEGIEYYTKKKEQLASSFEEEQMLAQTSPEEFKTSLYKEGAINQFASAFSWETNKKNLLSSPVLESQHWEKDYALSVSKFNLDKAEFSHRQWIDSENLSISKAELELKLKKSHEEKYGSLTAPTAYFGNSTEIKNPVAAVRRDIVDYEIASNKFLADYAKANNVSITVAKAQLQKYMDGDTSAISAGFRTQANEYKKNIHEAQNLKDFLAQAEQHANTSQSVISQSAELQKNLKSLPPVNVVDKQGNKVSFSQNEIFEFSKKIPNISSKVVGFGATAPERIKQAGKAADLSKLSNKEKLLYNIVNSNDPKYNNVKQLIGSKYTNVIKQHTNAVKVKDEVLNNYIMERNHNYIGENYAITTPNEEAKNHMQAVTMNALTKYSKSLNQQSLSAEGLDTDKLRGWLEGTSKNDLFYSKVIQGEKTFLRVMKGTEEQLIPLEGAEIRSLPVFENEPSAIERKVTTAQGRSNKRNTNISGNPNRAFFQKEDFPGVKNLQITADLEAASGNRGEQYINLNIKLPSGKWTNLQLDDYPKSINDAVKIFNTNFTDEFVKQIFLKDPRVSQQVKQEILTIK